MRSTPFARLLLATLLTTSLGLATAATPALATGPSRHHGSEPAKKRKKKPTVKVATTSLGAILVAGNGKTLYAFDPDGTDTSTSHCTGGCAGIWPALSTSNGKVVAGKGLDASKLTVGAANQVAYNGHLLYFYAPDAAPGDTGGQGIGGVWHVVGNDGSPIT
jgi:predicted lipoprotein with Yx(FWY)xxD motif